MKVKELINDIMAEKEVSEEKEEASLISYDGSYQSIININNLFDNSYFLELSGSKCNPSVQDSRAFIIQTRIPTVVNPLRMFGVFQLNH